MLEYYMEAASTYAGKIDDLVWLILIIVGIWFVLCEALFIGLILKFRNSGKSQYISGEKPEQMKWISRPHLLVLLCDAVLIIGAIRVWVEIKQDLPEADRTIRIIGQQWSWTYVDPGADGELDTEDDIKMVDDLVIEKDKTYHFKLSSRDVMHDFSVPVFRLKQDAVPGREIVGWFNATKTGEYDIQCAEMCGVAHGIMKGRIKIKDSAGFAAWVAENSPGTQLAAVNPAPANSPE